MVIEEYLFRPDVAFKCVVIVKVIVGDVGKNGAGKMQALNPSLGGRMRTYFHETMRAACFNHSHQQFVDLDWVRRGMGGGHHLILDSILHGRKQAACMTKCAKKLVQLGGNGCLSVRACNSNELEFR